MAGKRIVISGEKRTEFRTNIRVGDSVMVLAGGNKKKQKALRGQVGKVLRVLPKKNRVIVEGLNMVKRHKKAMNPNEPSGIIQKEGSVHISNVQYYSEQLKKPVRISFKLLEDGRKVRGYLDRKSGKFEQIDV